MSTDDQELCFAAFKRGLETRFGEMTYKSYFAGLTLRDWTEQRAVIATDNRYQAERITHWYADEFISTWDVHCGRVEEIELTGGAGMRSVITKSKASRSAGARPSVQLSVARRADRAVSRPVTPQLPPRKSMATSPVAKETDRHTATEPTTSEGEGSERFNDNFNVSQTFESFSVNDTNRMAVLAIEQIIEGAGSPVTYIYGGVGRGKSHLLSAAANQFLRRYPGRRLIFLTYDSLVADVSDAIVSRSLKELRAHLRDTDLLIFDDVHMLRGRKRTQEELACLIERLEQMGKPILVTGAVSPKELAETGILCRLTDRLGGGARVPLNRPDYDLRLKIAQRCSDVFTLRTGLQMPRRHIEYIARKSEGCVRELLGAMRFYELSVQLDPTVLSKDDQETQAHLAQVLKSRRRETTLDDVFDVTADQFGVGKDDLRGKSRKRYLVHARHAFALAARRLTDAPLAAIGGMLQRDHTTVINSITKGEILAESDQAFGEKISKIFEAFEQ
ncbi:chromosomal replication initiator protein DnaA [Parvularcula bermudensis HTCC2503]|uniref:Chromosomal replication initiator protein DnaA n=1 Tax=Parvularcula bermudensis (strain ATCC BAA-594 / HTCC2503 / KCTC 12087) TaxID=314260 RepID=E0TBJ8_PARBH|nr:DnaA/Hda family protein [Parvularcula bermudensis]ADM08373.1 chromosomal replication initiator protein DnaA [Parvularcula bermudensis HTCC2503]